MKYLKWALACAVILGVVFMSGTFSVKTQNARMTLVKSYVYAGGAAGASEKTSGEMTQYDDSVLSVLLIRDTNEGTARREMTLAVFNAEENKLRLIAIPTLTRARVLGGGPIFETVGEALEGVTPEEGGERAVEAVRALFGGVPISDYIFMRDSAADEIAQTGGARRDPVYGDTNSTDYWMIHQGLLLTRDVILAMKRDGLSATLERHADGGIIHNLGAQSAQRMEEALMSVENEGFILSVMPGADRVVDVRSFFLPDDIQLKELILELYYKSV